MKAGTLIPLVGFIFNLLLAVFVFSRSPRATANRVYLFLGIGIALWNLGQFSLFHTNDPKAALFWRWRGRPLVSS